MCANLLDEVLENGFIKGLAANLSKLLRYMILQLLHPTNRALLKLSHSHDTHVAHLTPPIHNEWVKSINKLNINISRHRLLRQQQPSPLMTLGERREWCESSCKGYARMAAAGHVLIKWQPQQRISQLRPADGRSCRRWGETEENTNEKTAAAAPFLIPTQD